MPAPLGPSSPRTVPGGTCRSTPRNASTFPAGTLEEGHAYRVRAVDASGVEGGAGPYAITIPSAPQWLFSKEDGAKCHLKWVANPEKGLQGYRVYRIESPRINGPGQPVTRV